MMVLRRLLVVAAVGGAYLIGVAFPAAAHTSLEASVPARDSVVAASPAEVALYFDEAVAAGLGAVRVVGPGESRADLGRAVTKVNVVHVPLRRHLAAGTYVVVWRVLSDDGHAVSGRFSFAVGHVGATPRAAARSSPIWTRGLSAGGRFLSYLGLVLFAGALILVALIWRGGTAQPGVRRLVVAGWTLVVVGTSVGYLMQGPNGAGLGPTAVLAEPRLLLDVMHTRFGQLQLARLVGLLALTPRGGLHLLAAAGRTRTAVLLAGLAALVATWSASGHAGTRSPEALFVGVDVVHLLAVSAWLGGLCVVLVALLNSPDVADVAPAWSRMAFLAVVVLIVTGSVTALAEVGSWAALWHSRYGQLLCAKVALVAVMVGVGALGRLAVQSRRHGSLHLTVRHEITLGTAVVLVTTALVATPPR